MDILKELENLQEKENLEIQLKKEILPLVMWGAGELAGEINEYLKMNNIFLADIFVDDEYYSEEEMFDGKQVISFSMLVKKYKQVNLIMGSSNYEKIDFWEKKEIVNKVFYLFSVNYGLYEKTSIDEIEKNIEDFKTVYDLLEDDKSRNVLLAYLKTRVSGNNSYITDVYEKEGNFFNNDIFRIHQQEMLLDIGAFDGDTIRLFLKENDGKYIHIYALEPDMESKKRLEKYIEAIQLTKITTTHMGAWDKKKELYFTAVSEQISSVVVNENESKEKVSIKVNQLDDLFDYEDKVTILKINYLEGVKEALRGAEYILKHHKPKLAITVGFDCKNIRNIPILIKEINPEYKLFLRFNRGMISSLTCYGIV